jgi:cysteine desulfurase
MMTENVPLYLDYQATTPCDPRVVAAMMPFFTERFGNAGSVTHAYGREAAAAVERARAQVASLIGADPREIVFTSGATESNNLAVKGAARFHREFGRDHVVVLVTEHKCVLESALALQREGFRVTFVPVGPSGLVDLEVLAAAIDERTAIVSVMAAHNEIGVLQPLREIGALCRAQGALLHTDAAQAAGKVPLDMGSMGVDLLSISGHKIYGPKGIGALYVRRRPRARIAPLFDGGGQERGMRSGTLPVALCVALGEAAAVGQTELDTEAARLNGLRARLLTGLQARIPHLRVNGDLVQRLPGNLNVAVPGVSAIDLLAACPGLALSTGSACTAAEIEPSHVLKALGLDDDLANASIRIGLGRWTSPDEIDHAVAALGDAVATLRADGVRGTGMKKAAAATT